MYAPERRFRAGAVPVSITLLSSSYRTGCWLAYAKRGYMAQRRCRSGETYEHRSMRPTRRQTRRTPQMSDIAGKSKNTVTKAHDAYSHESGGNRHVGV